MRAMSDGPAAGTRLARFLGAFFPALEAAGARYCVLRNYADLPQHTENDIDIWVSDQPEADLVLRRIARDLDLDTVMTSTLGVRNYWLVPSDDRLAGAIHVDLVAALRWRSTTLVPGDAIVGARRQYNGLWVPDHPIEGA